MLEKILIDKQAIIESWFQEKWKHLKPTLTCSVDIRNAGFKISAIDTNLFPAGFNNLDPAFFSLYIQAAQSTLNKYYPACKNIAIVVESHTRNATYYESVATLMEILEQAGYQVKAGSLLDIKNFPPIHLASGRTLQLYPFANLQYDLILLNNDLSEGVPPLLQNKQLIDPPLQLGWHSRSKFQHFLYYSTICEDFAKLIEIDPWLLSPFTENCGEIDFIEQSGVDCLAGHTIEVLARIQEKYSKYNIDAKPFVIIKADNGTYGMAVMTIHDVEELYHLNHKRRMKMATIKGGIKVRRVLIQEGIYTHDKINQEIAEPVIYLLGQDALGGFYRVNPTRKNDENLNSKGMHFEKMPRDNLFYVYSVIARLAALATGLENG